MRAKGWLNETIATLLLNSVAIFFVQYFVYAVVARKVRRERAFIQPNLGAATRKHVTIADVDPFGEIGREERVL